MTKTADSSGMLSLRPYQAEDSEYMREAGRVVNASEPGTGKTPTALLAAEGRTLAIAPAALAPIWVDHHARWRPELDLTICSYSGVPIRLPDKNGRMGRVGEYPRLELTGPWDTVICDEAHYLKERTTKWTKAVGRIKTDRLYMLTGTPLPNWGYEVYMLLKLLYPGDPRFTNYWRWVRKWFNVWEPPWGGWDIRGLKKGISWRRFAEENGIPGHWRRRKLVDVAPEIPPLTEQTIEAPMQDKQAAVYRRLKKDAYATLPDTGAEVISWSDGGVWGKMLQCSTGLQTLDPRETGTGKSGKLAVLEEVLRDREYPTVVFCWFRHTADAVGSLAHRLGKTYDVIHGGSKELLGERVVRFQEGRTQVLACTYSMMSEGWTLTASDTVVFLEPSARPDWMEQATNRIRRLGQTRPCLAISIVAPNTVEIGLRSLVGRKDRQTGAAVAAFDRAS